MDEIVADETIEIHNGVASILISDHIVSELANLNILFTWKGTNRFRDGSRIIGSASAVMNQFSLIESGKNFCEIGSYSYMRSPPAIGMSIGRYCSIGTGMKVLGTAHPIDRFTTSPLTYSRKFFVKRRTHPDIVHPIPAPLPIVIGNDVWIGQDVTLSSGINVGTGAIIAAGAVVVKNIPDYEIWGGVPARKIRNRFADEEAALLLSSRWWERNADQLRSINMTLPIPIFVKELDRIPIIQPSITDDKLVDIINKIIR